MVARPGRDRVPVERWWWRDCTNRGSGGCGEARCGSNGAWRDEIGDRYKNESGVPALHNECDQMSMREVVLDRVRFPGVLYQDRRRYLSSCSTLLNFDESFLWRSSTNFASTPHRILDRDSFDGRLESHDHDEQHRA